MKLTANQAKVIAALKKQGGASARIILDLLAMPRMPSREPSDELLDVMAKAAFGTPEASAPNSPMRLAYRALYDLLSGAAPAKTFVVIATFGDDAPKTTSFASKAGAMAQASLDLAAGASVNMTCEDA